MSFFRKTGVKIAASILCIASFTAAVVSGLFIVLLIAAGSYDDGTAPFEHLVSNRMSMDSQRILFD